MLSPVMTNDADEFIYVVKFIQQFGYKELTGIWVVLILWLPNKEWALDLACQREKIIFWNVS